MLPVETSLPAEAPRSLPVRLWPGVKQTIAYWMETETHVYGFSIAANVLLSFFPFLVVILALARGVFGTEVADAAMQLALRDYFPQDLLAVFERPLRFASGALKTTSVFVLLFAANGVFEPLEVALNRAFGIRTNRSFLKNQVVSFGLIFACGGLILLSVILTALNQQGLPKMMGGVSALVSLAFFKMTAVILTMLALYLVYKYLPNGEVANTRAIPAAIAVGAMFEVLKYVNLLIWPWLRRKLLHEVPPFVHSSAIILYAFFASMLVLAGAEWAARRNASRQDAAGSLGAAEWGE